MKSYGRYKMHTCAILLLFFARFAFVFCNVNMVSSRQMFEYQFCNVFFQIGPIGKLEMFSITDCGEKVNSSTPIVSDLSIRNIASDRKAFFANITLPFDLDEKIQVHCTYFCVFWLE